MAEIPRKVHVPRLTGLLLLASLALANCGTPQTQAQLPPVDTAPIALATPTADLSEIQHMMDAGAALRSQEDVAMLDSTRPGIDLTYYENPAVQAIRSIQDTTERIMAAIGWIDVERFGRFNYDIFGVYDCNGYALDLLRLLLGNDVIGSRYSLVPGEEGMPSVAGLSFYNASSQEQVNAFDATHPFLDSNNLDAYMKQYGATYGWKEAMSQEELKTMLQAGAVALGVTSEEFLQQQEPGYIGHALVVADGKTSFIVSQATNNHRIIPFAYNSLEEKVNPATQKYSFWVHQLPPPITP
jgi:hypothetical protein